MTALDSEEKRFARLIDRTGALSKEPGGYDGRALATMEIS
jgi:hypothetical protein